MTLTSVFPNKVKDLVSGSQWQVLFANIAAIVRASKPTGTPAVIGNDATDNEGHVVVDCAAFIKGRQLHKRIVVRIVRMAHDERWHAISTTKWWSMARFDGGHMSNVAIVLEGACCCDAQESTRRGVGENELMTLAMWRKCCG